MLLRALSSFLLTVLPLLAQGDRTGDKPAGQATEPKLLHVRVIGASVSGGFEDGPMTGATEQGDSVTLQHVLKAWCGDHARATTHATTQMLMMFMQPDELGAAQIAGVQKTKPDLVVGIDFPFWFAYGHVNGDECKARRELLVKGCELMTKIDVPLLIGDLPDMTGAAPRMLSSKQIPSKEVLAELNKQLAEFVKQHTNMRQVPLSQHVQVMKEKGAVLPLASGPLQTAPGALLQGDHLHATRLGMAYLGHVLQDPLREMFPKDHPLHAQVWTFEQFVEACGAEPELDTLRDAAKGDKKEAAGAKKEPVPAGKGG